MGALHAVLFTLRGARSPSWMLRANKVGLAEQAAWLAHTSVAPDALVGAELSMRKLATAATLNAPAGRVLGG